MKRFRQLAVAVILMVTGTVASAGEPALPFPDALDAAAIAVPRLDDLREDSLLLGNGDLNGLLYSEGAHLVLRLTKNDVWDARLDAQLNPPLPTLKRIKELAVGDWPNRDWILPEGSPWKPPDSYHAHPYPCPRACGLVRLGTAPAKPLWRRIRAEGQHNAWERRGDATVMSIRGQKEASNGYAFGPLDLSTDDYPTLRLRLAGTENARVYVDVMHPDGGGIFGSGWRESPTQSEEQVFTLPPGRRAASIILYTWTEDGKDAENRFESVVFEGPKGKLPIDLTLIAPPSSAARLDLRRGVAEVAGAPDGVPKAVVRALAQTNVFLIETPAEATLVPVLSRDLPAPTTGETDGVKWAQQVIPGDDDWPGLTFAIALAARGERKAVAIATSREAQDPTAAAVKVASQAIAVDPALATSTHEAEWVRFWAASGLALDDPLLTKAWYQNLYFLRCVSKRGVVAPGLFASLVDDHPAWHGDYHTNYNIQQTFWGTYITNHADLAEPYDRLIVEYLPRARWLARTVFGCGGAYYPHVLFAYEPPDPEKCKAPGGRQYIHHVWGFSLCVAGFTVQPLWWHYKYEPSRELLEKVAYPAVRDVALFYADFLDGCEKGPDGQVVLAPSVSPEHWGWTPKFERNRNCAFDIAMVRYILEAAIEGTTILGRDADLAARFRQALARLPRYPTTEKIGTGPISRNGPAGASQKSTGKSDPSRFSPVVVDMEGAPPINYNIAVPACPVFPCDVVTWRSPADERQLFARTIEKLAWNGNNSMVILGTARARLSMPGTLDWLREEVQTRLRPNQTITLNRLGHHFNAFGHYTEQFGVTIAISELLMQSVGDTIRLFPAWPTDRAAKFTNLRAQGGFLVSASLNEGKVGPVTIASTAGGKLRLLSPWPAARVRRGDGPAAELKPDAQGILELDTTPGERLTFAP